VMSAVPPTKLGLIMMTKELSRQLDGTGVTINALHPGLVKTSILKDTGFFLRLMFKMIPQVSPEKGAETSIYLATSPEVEKVSGKFFADKKEAAITPEANDESKQKKLFEVSKKLANI
jgi:NAD(P)-dependent dehydrogenase (short-subunit alcohol dehydrogenase family)